MYECQKNFKIELHTHSSLSDGVLSPQELIEFAISSGLNVLAITDHNCINPNLKELQDKYHNRILLPTGCEFSVGYKTVKGRLLQLHIGGIGFENDDEINRIVNYNNEAMRPYIEGIIKKLSSVCGIELCTYDELKERTPAISIGRRHIACELLRQDYVKSIDEAFDMYIGDGKPAFISNASRYATLQEVVPAIANSGVPILNHLYKYNLTDEETDVLLAEFKYLGGIALEVYYSAYDHEKQAFLEKLSKSYGLLSSCGSDYHGDSEIKELGRFPYEIYDRMIQNISK